MTYATIVNQPALSHARTALPGHGTLEKWSELTFHGKVIGQVNPAEKKNRYMLISGAARKCLLYNRREGDDPYVAIEQLKQGRKGRGETL